MKKNLKISSAFLAFAAIAFIFAGDQTRAAATYLKTCDLAVYPYNPYASSDTTGDSATATMNPLDYACRDHLLYPESGVPMAYSPQPVSPADNPAKPGSEQLRVPFVKHDHAYFNDSDHNAPGDYFYKSFVDKFEVTIQPDGFDNIYQAADQIACDTQLPVGWAGDVVALSAALGYCEGTFPGLYGGTTITKIPDPATRTITITWDFGVNVSNGVLPQIWGNNGAFSTPSGVALNLTDPENRKFQMSVHLHTQNKDVQAWSATTTSRVLIGNLAMLKTNYHAPNWNQGCEYGGWCFLPTPAEFLADPVTTPGGSRPFYWFPVGSTASVWKKPPLPTLMLIKTVINDEGGTATVADFPLAINGIPATSGTANTLPPGNYTASETSRSGYTAGVWSGDCSSSGAVTLNLGDNKTCTITNNDIQQPSPPPELPPTCQGIALSPSQFNTTVTGSQSFQINVTPSNFTGLFAWTLNNPWPGAQLVVDQSPGNLTRGAVLLNPTPNTNQGQNASITVRSPDYPSCSAESPGINPYVIIPPPPAPPPPPPPPPVAPPAGVLTKNAFEVLSRSNIIKLNQTAEFRIMFQPLASVPELILRDTLRDTMYGTDNAQQRLGGEIHLVRNFFSGKDFKIEAEDGGTRMIPECPTTGQTTSLCYAGNPFSASGIRIRNINSETIILTYRGKLTKSNISPAFCRQQLDRSFCGEKFTNEVSDSLNHIKHDTLFTPCPFLLTQGIGDVILERDLGVGSDISSCGPLPNIEGPTFTPPPPPPPAFIPRTGTGTAYKDASHTFCKESGNENFSGSRPEGYQNPLKSVSSAICEISQTLGQAVTQPTIRASVLENIARITRGNDNLGVGRAVTISNLNDLRPWTVGTTPNPNAEIYKIKNASLTIDANSPLAHGAKTFVIENGDLIITRNIAYEATSFDLKNTKDIPSIAFIVINGNIQVAPNVRTLSGVYMTFSGARTGSGKIISKENAPSENQLVINGSVYGDIEPLFESRGFSGSASRGQGTVTINYDGRLFYNMPPGLQEILDVSSEQVAR